MAPTRKTKQPFSKRKKLLLAIIILTILAAFSWVLTEMPHLFTTDDKTPASMYSDEVKSFLFYPIDPDIDITADRTYMELDRYVYYKTGGETMAITDGNYARYGRAVTFFGDYFSTVIAGDADTYNTFFTDRYYKTAAPLDDFPPQMLYDILIEELSMTENEDKTTTYAFNVSYKIHRNTGTFRNDIGSDAGRVLYFELLESADGTVKIDRITYYK